MQSFHQGVKICCCCSSAFCVCFCQCRQPGFLLFSLFTNPLYPNCAVLNISRHTGKVMQLSWRAKHSVLPGIMVPSIKCYHRCCSAPSSVGSRGVCPATASLLSCRRRPFKAGTGCFVGAEGAVLVERTRGTSNPPNPFRPAASNLAFCQLSLSLKKWTC